jgi:aspartate/methionine/tyrosine aminotransferase/2-polyprenyl-6-methoxyphenol hydroxylase-like FAD-dependent oxidoreductase
MTWCQDRSCLVTGETIMRVGIFGAGVAGLACALAMRRRCGFSDVRVFERDTTEQAATRAGHGAILMQNGVAALRALGAGRFLDTFRPLEKALVQDENGVVVWSEAMSGVYCVTRTGIHDALRAELPVNAVAYGRRVTDVETGPVGSGPARGREADSIGRSIRSVHFEAGTSLTADDVDLFVGADGWRSPMFEAFNPGVTRELSPVFEIVTSTQVPDLALQLGSTFLKTEFRGRGLAFGLISPAPDHVIGYLQFDRRRHGCPRELSGDSLRPFVTGLVGEAPEPVASYLRQADFSTAHLWRPTDTDVAAGLCSANAVLIGDAGHPLLPFTSQGVSVALEDAVMLADVVGLVRDEPDLLPRTLAGFARDRTADLAPCVTGGRQILARFAAAGTGPDASYVGGSVSGLSEHQSMPLEDLRSFFGLVDAGGDGHLSQNDLHHLLDLVVADSFSAAETAALFEEMDADDDGLIGRPEWLRAVAGCGEASAALSKLRENLTPRRIAAAAVRHRARPSVLGVDDELFADDRVDLRVLRDRSYNHRWAVHAPDVIPLTAADNDFPVCQEIIAAVQRYLADGYVPYGPPEGLPELRNAAAEALRAERGLPCTPHTLLPTDGAASAMFLVARHIITEPGDEAIIPDPVDFLLQRSIRAHGGVVRRWPLAGGRFDVAALESLVTPRTRLLFVCNPHNPLGRVFARHELDQLADVALRHNLWIISDEVWSDIVFAPHQHGSIASLDPAIAARTFTVLGFSKSYSLAGMRLGLIATPDQAHRDQLMTIAHAHDTAYGPSTVSQIAGTAAYHHGRPWLTRFVAHLQRQRDYAVARLNAMPGVACETPQGTFVVFPDISQLGLDQDAFADRLLTRHRLAVVPGSPRWFGPGAAGHVRLSLATSRGILADGLDRFEEGVEAIHTTGLRAKR